MAIINVILPDRKQAQYGKKEKKKNLQRQWSCLLPWFKKNKSIRLGINLEPAVVYQNITCNRRLKGTLQLIETWLLFGNIRYIYTPLCTPGQEQQRPCTSTIHLQPGLGVVRVSSLLWLQAALLTDWLTDWPPVSAFGQGRDSQQHPVLVEHSNCRVIRAFKSPNTTKVSNNTSKSS